MSKLTEILGKFAPLLNLVLPGSGLVLSGLLSLFGAKDENDLADKIATDPDSAIKLKEFQIEHQNDLYALQFQDRNSARTMNSEVSKATGKTDWCMHFLAISYTLAFFIYSCVALVYQSHFDKGMWHDLLNVEMLILSFYFGASYIQSRASTAVVTLPPPADTRFK